MLVNYTLSDEIFDNVLHVYITRYENDTGIRMARITRTFYNTNAYVIANYLNKKSHKVSDRYTL